MFNQLIKEFISFSIASVYSYSGLLNKFYYPNKFDMRSISISKVHLVSNKNSVFIADMS